MEKKVSIGLQDQEKQKLESWLKINIKDEDKKNW